VLALALVVLAAAAVFVIAALLIGREARRLDDEAPRPVFDVEEAVAWIADRLPPGTTARLTPTELRQVLEWSLEALASPSGPIEPGEPETVVEDDDAVAYVLARAAADGVVVEEIDVREVLTAQTAYLEAIGAVRSFPPERGGGPAEE
jgi:hypothetical protein